jgi:uncharacterized protein (TIGR02284 family)
MELNREALDQIQKLIEANFSGRDELYAAARSLDHEARRKVCRRLAEHLAGHAAELQQIVTACGVQAASPLDVDEIAYALFELARVNRGETGVLEAAAEGEQNLRQDYDQALDEVSNPAAENMLRRQRRGVEFGEQVLRGMTDDGDGDDDDKQDRPGEQR